jgi:hypothetical protein
MHTFYAFLHTALLQESDGCSPPRSSRKEAQRCSTEVTHVCDKNGSFARSGMQIHTRRQYSLMYISSYLPHLPIYPSTCISAPFYPAIHSNHPPKDDQAPPCSKRRDMNGKKTTKRTKKSQNFVFPSRLFSPYALPHSARRRGPLNVSDGALQRTGQIDVEQGSIETMYDRHTLGLRLRIAVRLTLG